MITFIKWLAIQAIVWTLAVAGGHYWLHEEPRRILIGIDASFPMNRDWQAVRERVDALAARSRYSEFAVVTGKSRVHGWRDKPAMDGVVTYGPRHLDRITDPTRYPEIEQADKRVLITNAEGADIDGWDVLRP
ncbi:MAG: hypothetical protein ACPG4N_00500 [Gammaproteobacteria bacterium]